MKSIEALEGTQNPDGRRPPGTNTHTHTHTGIAKGADVSRPLARDVLTRP